MFSVFRPNGYYIRNRKKQSILYSLSEVLCLFALFLHLSACSRWFSVFRYVACVRLQWSAKLSPKLSRIEPNWCQNHSEFIKNQSQIDQNDAQERSESDLGIKSVPGTVFWSTIGASEGAFCHHVVAAWVILGTILDTAGRQGYPKIKHFGTWKHQKSEKWCPGRGVGKSLKFWWNFDWKKGGLEAPGHRFYCSFTVLFEDSHLFRKSWKFNRKWFPQCSQNP